MSVDVSLLGNLNVDLTILGNGPENWDAIFHYAQAANVQLTAAGTVGYTSQDLAKLGLQVQVISTVSDDPFSVFILNTLKRSGVGTSQIQIEAGKDSGMAIYMLLFGDRKRPAAYRMPTHNPWPQHLSPRQMDAILNARLFHSGGYLHFKDHWHGIVVEIYKEAKRKGLMTSMDPQFPLVPLDPPWMGAIEDILPFVDFFICDENEAVNLTNLKDLNDAAKMLLSKGPQTVVIKKGSQGSTLYQSGWVYHQPAVILGEVLDSVGAGDAFCAGFIYGTLQAWSLEKRAAFASTAAGFTVLGVGGTDTFVSLDRILEELPK